MILYQYFYDRSRNIGKCVCLKALIRTLLNRKSSLTECLMQLNWLHVAVSCMSEVFMHVILVCGSMFRTNSYQPTLICNHLNAISIVIDTPLDYSFQFFLITNVSLRNSITSCDPPASWRLYSLPWGDTN